MPLKNIINISLVIILSIYLSNSAFADLYVNENDITFSTNEPMIGQELKIFVKINNSSDSEARGVVKIFDETEGIFIGGDQSIAVLANSSDNAFASFTPQKAEDHKFAIRVIPFDESNDNPNNDKAFKNILIDLDTDGDGIGNRKDPDDDNDGAVDAEDKFPLDKNEKNDSDNDGIGDNADDDDDNDGVKDIQDAFPKDANESMDSDNDGIGDNADDDDDNDGVKDVIEIERGTDQLKADSDGDGILDGEDDFPLDSSKAFDTDRDGIENSIDDDDDNDGVKDDADLFPLNPKETYDSDKDGIGDNGDEDDDNDKLSDSEEFEKGTNPKDPDTDGDGALDGEDDFPLNPNEQKDSDKDGLGDNEDENDQNKGPMIIANISKDSAKKGEKIIFDASGSYDPDGVIKSFLWELSKGEESVTEGKFEKTFHSIGKKTIVLTVTDNAGETRQKTFIISVKLSFGEIALWSFGIIFLLILAGTSKKSFKVKNISR